MSSIKELIQVNIITYTGEQVAKILHNPENISFRLAFELLPKYVIGEGIVRRSDEWFQFFPEVEWLDKEEEKNEKHTFFDFEVLGSFFKEIDDYSFEETHKKELAEVILKMPAEEYSYSRHRLGTEQYIVIETIVRGNYEDVETDSSIIGYLDANMEMVKI